MTVAPALSRYSHRLYYGYESRHLHSDALFKEAEAAAKALGISRSKLVQTALQAFLQRRRDEKVTAALNRSYARHPRKNSIHFCRVSLSKAMKRTEWKE